MSHHHHRHDVTARSSSPPRRSHRRPHRISSWGQILIVLFTVLMLLGEWGSGIWST